MEKYEQLKEHLKQYKKLCVAFSGGANSTLLLKAALDALGKENVIAVIADTDFLARNEIENAKKLAEEIGADFCVANIDILYLPQIAHNEFNRCYHCKKTIFTDIAKTAYIYGIKTIADGRAFSPSSDYRPGTTATAELGVVSPLADCEIDKKCIREISETLALPTWNKPINSCLATRFPFDTEITKEKLEIADKAEKFLSEHVDGILRCRVHGAVLRIETRKEQFENVINAPGIVDFMKELGFQFITLDLEGYRSGSMNNGD